MFASRPVSDPISVAELAKLTGLQYRGDGQRPISKVSSLSLADATSLCFIRNDQYLEALVQSQCAACIVPEAIDLPEKLSAAVVLSDNPHRDFLRVIEILGLYRGNLEPGSVHSSAIIADSASISDSASIAAHCVIGERVKLGENIQIGAGCVIEDDVEIGDHSKLMSNVTICFGSKLGRKVIVQPGAVIGGDGFGLVFEQGEWLHVPHLGNVLLGDRVEVGANTTIDRGALDDTVIGTGVKLDNLIQIGHNVQIGDYTAIAGGVSIAGSAVIGQNCKISGEAAIVGHIRIADNVTVTAKTLVSHSIEQSGVYSSGTPMMENRLWRRNAVRFKTLDQLHRTVKKIEP